MGLELRHIPAPKLSRGATLIIASNPKGPFLNIQRRSPGPTHHQTAQETTSWPGGEAASQGLGEVGCHALRNAGHLLLPHKDKALHLSQGAHTNLLSHLPRSFIPETGVKHPLWTGLSQQAQVAWWGGTPWASDSDPNVNTSCLIQPMTLNFPGSSHVKRPPP